MPFLFQITWYNVNSIERASYFKPHLHERAIFPWQVCFDKEKLLVQMGNSWQIFLVKENLAC